MRTCRELAELGMELARAAAREAVGKLDTPREHPMPGAHLPPDCPTADPGRLFTRVCHAVRQAMALELRIAEGTICPDRGQAQPRHPRPDPRPCGSHPGFRQEPAERLEDDVHPIGRAIPDILDAIRQVLGTAMPQSAATAAEPAPLCTAAEPQPPWAATRARKPARTQARPQPPPRLG